MYDFFENLKIIPFELWLIFGGIVATTWGSFFNVVIWRMPRGESVMHPPSKCPKCGNGIAWYDNVPVFGWIWLKGKCRICKNPISIEYPLVEALTGLVGVLMLYATSIWLPMATWADYLVAYTLGLILVPVIIIDIRHFLIPDMMVLPGALIALALSPFRHNFGLLESVLGGFGVAIILWVFATFMSWVLKKQAMGFGDVKYMLFAGAILGLGDSILTIVLSSFIGLALIPILTLVGSHENKTKFPFGPMLGIATVISFFWADTIWQGYLSFINS